MKWRFVIDLPRSSPQSQHTTKSWEGSGNEAQLLQEIGRRLTLKCLQTYQQDRKHKWVWKWSCCNLMRYILSVSPADHWISRITSLLSLASTARPLLFRAISPPPPSPPPLVTLRALDHIWDFKYMFIYLCRYRYKFYAQYTNKLGIVYLGWVVNSCISTLISKSVLSYTNHEDLATLRCTAHSWKAVEIWNLDFMFLLFIQVFIVSLLNKKINHAFWTALN